MPAAAIITSMMIWKRLASSASRMVLENQEPSISAVPTVKPRHIVAGESAPQVLGVQEARAVFVGWGAAGLVDNTRGSLAAWIADPQTMKPGSNMPIVPLSSEELRQISAYMASLK